MGRVGNVGFLRACARHPGLTAALALCVASTAGAQSPAPGFGYYLDEHDQAIPISEAVRLHFPAERPHYLRTTLEMLGILGIGTTWYWLDWRANRQDWDDPNIVDRFDGNAVRFDNNHFTINNLTHPLDGAAMYVLGRANNLNVQESFLAAAATSAVWEYALEFREKVSINDLIMTPAGGMALGEVFFQLSDYLTSAPGGGGWPQAAAAWTLGFPSRVHDWLDDREPPDGPTDALGFSAAWTHRFSLGYQTATATNDGASTGQLHGYEVHGELVSLPGYLRPGQLSLFFTRGNFTRFTVRGSFEQDGDGADFETWADATLFGYYTQDLVEAGGTVSGESAMVGLGVAFEHVQRWLPEPPDRMAVAHLPGLKVGMRLLARGFDVHLRLALHPDFGAVESMAADAWFAANEGVRTKSVLERFSYYYALGASTWLDVELAWQGIEAGARLRYGFFNSIEGHDREQEQVEVDVRVVDDILAYGGYVGYAPAALPLSGRLAFESTHRRGRAGDHRVALEYRRLMASVGLRF